MNQYLVATVALLFAVVPNLQAGELLAEPVPVAYVSVPFGGGSAKDATSFGLQLARMGEDAQRSGMLFDAERSAYLDVRFSQGDLSGLSLNGTDFVALAKLHGYNVNETNSFQQWWNGLSDNEKAFFAVAGIAAVGCAAGWCSGGRASSNEECQVGLYIKQECLSETP